MTKRKTSMSHFIERISIIGITFLVIFLVIIARGAYFTKNTKSQLIKTKLSGFWHIDIKKSICIRKDKFYLLNNSLSFRDYCIELPILDDSLEYERIIDSLKMKKTEIDTAAILIRLYYHNCSISKGIWFCDNNQDSLFIRSPQHILNGNYSISFAIEKQQEYKYLMILKNDSTFLICEKQYLPIDKRPTPKEWVNQ